MKRILAIAGVVVALGFSSAKAVQPDEIMVDPANEARARDLSRELRCMVCQNQSIDDSEAPLARDLRLLVRERIAARRARPWYRSAPKRRRAWLRCYRAISRPNFDNRLTGWHRGSRAKSMGCACDKLPHSWPASLRKFNSTASAL